MNAVWPQMLKAPQKDQGCALTATPTNVQPLSRGARLEDAVADYGRSYLHDERTIVGERRVRHIRVEE